MRVYPFGDHPIIVAMRLSSFLLVASLLVAGFVTFVV
jgi:hypothetical protein